MLQFLATHKLKYPCHLPRYTYINRVPHENTICSTFRHHSQPNSRLRNYKFSNSKLRWLTSYYRSLEHCTRKTSLRIQQLDLPTAALQQFFHASIELLTVLPKQYYCPTPLIRNYSYGAYSPRSWNTLLGQAINLIRTCWLCLQDCFSHDQSPGHCNFRTYQCFHTQNTIFLHDQNSQHADNLH